MRLVYILELVWLSFRILENLKLNINKGDLCEMYKWFRLIISKLWTIWGTTLIVTFLYTAQAAKGNLRLVILCLCYSGDSREQCSYQDAVILSFKSYFHVIWLYFSIQVPF